MRNFLQCICHVPQLLLNLYSPCSQCHCALVKVTCSAHTGRGTTEAGVYAESRDINHFAKSEDSTYSNYCGMLVRHVISWFVKSDRTLCVFTPVEEEAMPTLGVTQQRENGNILLHCQRKVDGLDRVFHELGSVLHGDIVCSSVYRLGRCRVQVSDVWGTDDKANRRNDYGCNLSE